MKKYIKPKSKVVNITPASMIAASQTLNLKSGTYTGEFNARSSSFSTWEEQESNE